ncbi:hypothetical protein ASPWEDRAFT_82528, partial [Aspergillus wentii DTO 134E9]
MKFTDCLVSVACLASTVSAFGNHAHRHGLLQLPRAFSREGIWLYPALHPDHDSDDLRHLDPQLSKTLHYSQEGHRHQTGDHRSFFRASNPTVDDEECMTVSAEPLNERQAIHAGDLSWGTFLHPEYQKRQPAKGHVKTTMPEQPTGETVDITKDPDAVQAFFDTTINTDIPDKETQPLDFMDNNYNQLSKRGLFSWILEGIQSIVKVSVHISLTLKTRCSRICSQIIQVATKIWVRVVILRNGFVLAQEGVAWNVQCVDCGARGHFSFDGRLAFSTPNGLTAAEIALTNHEPLEIDAVFRINLNGRVLKNKGNSKYKTAFTKELYNVGLPGLWIPKIVAIGPMVTVSTGVSLYFDGHMEIVTGA